MRLFPEDGYGDPLYTSRQESAAQGHMIPALTA